ncbi:MAG: hypothetical protein U0936_09850 [Planctomycetaceae bacterium]
MFTPELVAALTLLVLGIAPPLSAGQEEAAAAMPPQLPQESELAEATEPPQLVLSTEPAYQRPNHQRRDLPEEGQQFIRSVALILLPQKFDDEDGWGDEKRIQSGLNVDFDGGKLKTSRRWNMVNHGTWLRGFGELVDPEKTFTLRAIQLPDPDEETQRYEIHTSATLQVSGQQQQWNYGVMLWSISADAVVDLSLHAVLDVKSEVVTTDKGTRLRFVPSVTQATAKMENFRLHRISHLQGYVIQAQGELVEELLQILLRHENRNLPDRINKALKENGEKLEIPLSIGELFSLGPKNSRANDAGGDDLKP